MNTSFYLGIDVSKGYADFCMLDCKKNPIGRPFQLYDIARGHNALDDYLGTIMDIHKPEHIYAAVESTGSYENHWLETMNKLRSKYPLMTARLNPIGVSKHREAEQRNQVTDRESSKAIATYLINHTERITFNRTDPYGAYRFYLGHIGLLTKQMVQLKNDLHQFLYLYFPEVLPHCRNNLTDSILELLEQYPTSSDMAKSRQGKHNQISYFTMLEWQDLREKCKSGIGSSSDMLASMIIKDLAKQIKTLKLHIKELYDALYKLLPEDQLKILMSMPGIAKRTAIIMLCVFGDVSRFTGSHQMLGYFGVYPVLKESGDGKKRPHLSPKGNALLKKHLYLSAMVASHYDPYFKKLYLKSVEKGMDKKPAICKLMSKMLRMLYGMLINMQPYNPEIDASYIERYRTRNESIHFESNIKESEELCISVKQAPISKKHAKQRKEQTNDLARTRSSKSPSAPSE